MNSNIQETHIRDEGQRNVLERLLELPRWMIIGIPVVIIVLLFSISLFLEKQSKQQQPSPVTQQPTASPVFPTPTPDITGSWNTIINDNGVSIKYPIEGKIIPDEKTATSASSFQIVPVANKPASEQSVLGVEVISKTDSMIAGKSLLEIVNLVREKNTGSQILTKPISILFGGNDGYEWYLKGSTFTGIKNSFTAKESKQRVIQFDKEGKHYIIFSTFDDVGEQLLSTFRLPPQ